MSVSDLKQQEIDANYERFKAMLPDIIQLHRGKYAVMRHAKIVEYFDSARDALVFASHQYPDGLFSIQEVTDKVVDLGWFSYAPAYHEVRA